MIFGDHDLSCLNGIDGSLDKRFNVLTYRNERPMDMRTHYAEQCARDHKWRHVYDTIRRRECDCNVQFHTILIVYHLWKVCSYPFYFVALITPSLTFYFDLI